MRQPSVYVRAIKRREDTYYPPLPENHMYTLEWDSYELFPTKAPRLIAIYKNFHNSSLGKYRELVYQASLREPRGKKRWVITKAYTSANAFATRKTFNTPEEILAFLTMTGD